MDFKWDFAWSGHEVWMRLAGMLSSSSSGFIGVEFVPHVNDLQVQGAVGGGSLEASVRHSLVSPSTPPTTSPSSSPFGTDPWPWAEPLLATWRQRTWLIWTVFPWLNPPPRQLNKILILNCWRHLQTAASLHQAESNLYNEDMKDPPGLVSCKFCFQTWPKILSKLAAHPAANWHRSKLLFIMCQSFSRTQSSLSFSCFIIFISW